jgi:hypothetical protein
MTSEIERMGDLAVHVAKIARLRVPEVAVPVQVQPTVRRMAEVAEDMVDRVARIIENRDVDAAQQLRQVDEEMDHLRRENFREILSVDWAHGVEPAIDIALLGRYYERIADHAVSIANRVVFVVTGVRHGVGDQVGQVGVGDVVAAHQTQGVRRGGGLDHDVVLVDHHGTGAEHRQDRGDSRRHDRGSARGDGLLLAITDVPRQDGTAGDDGSEDGGKECLRRRVHALDRTQSFTRCSPRQRVCMLVFIRCSAVNPVWTLWRP